MCICFLAGAIMYEAIVKLLDVGHVGTTIQEMCIPFFHSGAISCKDNFVEGTMGSLPVKQDEYWLKDRH